jgi:hypothetical protein
LDTDTPTTSPSPPPEPQERSDHAGPPGAPEDAAPEDAAISALSPEAAQAPTAPGPRRRRAVRPSGTIDVFTQAEDETPPSSPSPSDLMALTRELRRFQSWSPDRPEARAALQAMVSAALDHAISTLPALLLPLKQTEKAAVAALEKLIRDAADEAARRALATDRALKESEKRANEIATQLKDTTKDLDHWLKTEGRKLKKLTDESWYRRVLPPLASSALCGTLMVILLTALRPGWTLTRDQQEALRIGQSVTAIYLTAPPERQAEMRKVNRWRSPDATDSTTAPPSSRRP